MKHRRFRPEADALEPKLLLTSPHDAIGAVAGAGPMVVVKIAYPPRIDPTDPVEVPNEP